MSDNQDTEVTSSSFAIVVTPEFNESGNWAGTIGVHMEEDFQNDLDVDELTQIRSVCGMMASTLTLMETDTEFMEYVRDYFLDNYQSMVDQFLDAVEEQPTFTRTKDGNVITLNFNTKTHGSA